MSIIRRDLPADAPVNPYPAFTPEWRDWAKAAYSSTDYVMAVFTDESKRSFSLPYSHLSGLRREIESGEACWFSVAEVLALEKGAE